MISLNHVDCYNVAVVNWPVSPKSTLVVDFWQFATADSHAIKGPGRSKLAWFVLKRNGIESGPAHPSLLSSPKEKKTKKTKKLLDEFELYLLRNGRWRHVVSFTSQRNGRPWTKHPPDCTIRVERNCPCVPNTLWHPSSDVVTVTSQCFLFWMTSTCLRRHNSTVGSACFLLFQRHSSQNLGKYGNGQAAYVYK